MEEIEEMEEEEMDVMEEAREALARALPCPHCGAPHALGLEPCNDFEFNPPLAVECCYCGVTGPVTREGASRAVELWNSLPRRSPDMMC